MPRSFTFATITEYQAAKGNNGAIYAELVSSGIKSGSCVSKITATGDVFIDSINLFVTPELGQEGDTLYYSSTEGYRFLRAGNTTWDADSYGQVYIDLAKIPSGFSVVAPYTDIFNFKQTDEKIGSGKASMTKILGNTVAWNQQFFDDLYTKTQDNCTVTKQGSVYVVNPNAGASSYRVNPTFSLTPNHKYYISTNGKYVGSGDGYSSIQCYNGSTWSQLGREDYSSSFQRKTRIITAPATIIQAIFNVFRTTNGADTDEVKIYDYMIVDLTLLYGPAIDGLTDAQILAKFESEFPGYHSYNEGTLISNKAKAIEFVGFNQWDGTYEAKKLFREGGVIEANEAYFITGYIPALPNTEYYVIKAYGSQTYLCFYDANYNFIGNERHSGGYALRVTSPANTAFIRDCCQNGYDYCISLSGPRNGQYEPYKKTALQVPITALRGKLNGQGNSVNIFPDGLKSAGDVYDEIGNGYAIKRVATRDYQSGDENNSAVTTDGQAFTNYALAEPEYYVLDRDFNWKYRVSEYHTKKMLPENGENPTSAPFACEIKQI